MFDPNMELLSTLVSAAAAKAEAEGPDAIDWSSLAQAREASGIEEEDLTQAIEGRDVEALKSIHAAWMAKTRHLPIPDRAVLKRAMKAFRKSLKVTRLDAESKIGGNPMTSGVVSDIVGIEPPSRYPKAVWDELVREGRLVADRFGTYELPPGG